MDKITPPGRPAPLTSTFGFVCKWCGGDRQVIYGYSAAHVCSEYHSFNEDLSFVGEQIRIHEGLPSPQETYASLRAMAAEINAEHSPRPPV